MLSDPLVLKSPIFNGSAVSTGETISLARVSEAGGASVYGPTANSLGLPVTLKINHSESRENPGGTKRVAARIDISGIQSNGEKGSMFAYIVVGGPKTGPLYATKVAADNNDDPCDIVVPFRHLLGAVAMLHTAFQTDEATLTRIYAGEA